MSRDSAEIGSRGSLRLDDRPRAPHLILALELDETRALGLEAGLLIPSEPAEELLSAERAKDRGDTKWGLERPTSGSGGRVIACVIREPAVSVRVSGVVIWRVFQRTRPEQRVG